MVDGREVQEPTRLALSLTATGVLLLWAVLAGVAFVTASFGLGRGLFAAVAGLLAALVLGPRRWHGESAAPVTGRRLWLRRLRITPCAGTGAGAAFLTRRRRCDETHEGKCMDPCTRTSHANERCKIRTHFAPLGVQVLH